MKVLASERSQAIVTFTVSASLTFAVTLLALRALLVG
jgi:hypothetical protein